MTSSGGRRGAAVGLALVATLTLSGCGDRALQDRAVDGADLATAGPADGPPAATPSGSSAPTDPTTAPTPDPAGTVVDQAALDAAEATLDEADRILDALNRELAEDEG